MTDVRMRIARWLFLGAMALALPRSAGAQCPDGSPPPCPRRIPTDTNVFVVLPFTVRGPESVQYLGASMVDLLHMALDDVGGMRIEYAPNSIRRFNELSDAGDAAGTALELGAGRLIGGTIVAIGKEVRIRADVFDAVRGRPHFSVEGVSTMENVPSAVDSIATKILAWRALRSSERSRTNINEYAAKSPAALQAYLVARQHARRGERRAAADSLKRAIAKDPDFGLAYLLLHRLESAQGGVTGMGGASAGQDSIARLARARIAAFPERVRFMFHEDRDGDRMRSFAWANEAVYRYPSDPDAAFYLADQYFHNGLNLGESLASAHAAFRRALALDDEDPELRQHFQVLLMEMGDTAATLRLDPRCRDVAADKCPVNPGFRILFRREDPHKVAVGADSLFWGTLAHFNIRLTTWDPAFGLAIEDSLAQLHASPGRIRDRREAAYVARSSLALARGQYERASQFLDSARAVNPARWGLHYLYTMLYHIVTGARGDEVLEDRINRAEENVLTNRLLVRAFWAAVRQPPDSAEALFRELEQRPQPDSVLGAAAATGLRGVVALRLGDTTRALELLTRARVHSVRRSIPTRNLLPGAYLALLRTKLEVARGNYERARLYLADLYPQNDYVPFIADVEELRAEIALAVGDTAEARVALRKMIAVWDRADPPLQPRVAAARATLARLEIQGKETQPTH